MWLGIHFPKKKGTIMKERRKVESALYVLDENGKYVLMEGNMEKEITLEQFKERLESIKTQKMLQEALADTNEWFKGLYNGLELAIAIMEDRPPVFKKERK